MWGHAHFKSQIAVMELTLNKHGMGATEEKLNLYFDHRSYTHNLSSCEMKAWKKKSDLNGIRTHDLCDTSGRMVAEHEQYEMPGMSECDSWCHHSSSNDNDHTTTMEGPICGPDDYKLKWCKLKDGKIRNKVPKSEGDKVEERSGTAD